MFLPVAGMKPLDAAPRRQIRERPHTVIKLAEKADAFASRAEITFQPQIVDHFRRIKRQTQAAFSNGHFSSRRTAIASDLRSELEKVRTSGEPAIYGEI